METNMQKVRVKLYAGGKMGELVRGVLMFIPHVELVEEDYDVLFSASWPGRITQEECSLAKVGAVNLHTGLLPRQRGWHPLNWSIVWGDKVTGITIHKIVDSYDAGDVCVQEEVPIFDNDTIRTLRARIDMVVPKVVAAFFETPGFYIETAVQQNQALVTYAPKRRPEDSELNPDATPKQIYDLWRSCDPEEYPAFIVVNGKRIVVVNAWTFLGDGDVERVRLELEGSGVLVC